MGEKVLYLVKGLLFAGLLLGVCLLTLAGIMFKFDVSEQTMKWLVLVVYIASVFIGGLYFAKHGEKRKFLWGVLFGLAFYVLYLILAASMGSLLTMGLGKLGVMLLLSIAGGMAGGMVCP